MQTYKLTREGPRPLAEIIVWAPTEAQAVDYLVDELGLDGDIERSAELAERDGLRPFRFGNVERSDDVFGCTGMPLGPDSE